LRVAAGSHNKGIYINITGGQGKGEKYHITHPVASVNGILRGSFYLTVGDTTIITCTGGKSGQMLRTLIEYKEEVSLTFEQMFVCSYHPGSPGLAELISSLRESFTHIPKAKPTTRHGSKSSRFPSRVSWLSSMGHGNTTLDGVKRDPRIPLRRHPRRMSPPPPRLRWESTQHC
jgi:hypothetical protein